MINGSTYTISIPVTDDDGIAYDLTSATQIWVAIYQTNRNFIAKISMTAKAGFDATMRFESNDKTTGVILLDIYSAMTESQIAGAMTKAQVVIYEDDINFPDGVVLIDTEIAIELAESPVLANEI